MSKDNNLHDFLQDVADAIREKKGSNEPINAQSFAEEIRSIEGGGGSDNALVDAILGRTITEYVSNSSADIGNYAFQGCNNLEKLSMPNLLSIGTGACYQCVKLKDVYLPKVKYVSANLFYGCIALVEIELPSVTDLSNAVFQNCTSLKKVDIGSACKKIGASFLGSSLLDMVIIRYPNVATLGNVSAFNNTPIASGTGFVYVPDDLVESYKSATNWSIYASQIKGLSELPNE